MATYGKVYSEEDLAFFDAVRAVFERHPAAKGRYAIASLAVESRMGIDLDRQVGISRIDGERIITEFVDRDSPVMRSASHRTCRKTDWDGECVEYWEPPV